MTEAEWLASDDREAMLNWAERTCWSERKSCLLACACYRKVGDLLTAGLRDVLRIVERYVDGRASTTKLANALRKWPFTWSAPSVNPAPQSASATFAALMDARRLASLYQGEGDPRTRARSLYQAVMIRDIFGNPFRPVSFDPSWRTGTAIRLAQVMYETRDFAAMPILSDALQDAGCEHADILDHCRGDSPHVRGCWVVDLVLGKA